MFHKERIFEKKEKETGIKKKLKKEKRRKKQDYFGPILKKKHHWLFMHVAIPNGSVVQFLSTALLYLT